MRIRVVVFIFMLSIKASWAQSVEEYKGKVSQQYTLHSSTVIIDMRTRNPVSLAEYDQRMKKAPGQFRLVPQFDRYGKVSSFLMVPKKGVDQQTILFESDLMPEVGEVLPAFEMTGLDGHTYTSERLKGKYILLGFWVRFEKPLYTLASTKVIQNFITKQTEKGIDIISLGTTLNTREECIQAIPKRNCGFIPVPESFGFNHRYHIGETPYFILIDKKGIVMAMAPHTDFDKIANLNLR